MMQPPRPGRSKGYLRHQPNMNDLTVARRAAADGSARLLAAMLAYYERRAKCPNL